ncbi:MAG: TIGR03915 family putative DNA repair protein [Bacteroidota bacterium]|nr:TIGR03915 family putative DNA repair protein [Bacteroidota bacterium]
MNLFIYDKTFEGFLTAVFEAYEFKQVPDKILGQENRQTFLFAEVHEVITDEEKAARVWTGLHKKLSDSACKILSVDFLSELPDVEMLLFRYIQKALASKSNYENNFGDADVMEVMQLFRKVSREAERVRMFVRFQKTVDDIYFASFDPKYNVLPLTISHFEDRFADQRWIIYDTHRKYGYYYDLESVTEIRLDDSKIHPVTGKLDESALDVNEKLFQELWKKYFENIAIAERRNPALHQKLLPKRFWKYLPEK